MSDDRLVLGPYEFTSRLFLGTGKYATNEAMVEALDVSGCEQRGELIVEGDRAALPQALAVYGIEVR